MSNPSLVRAAAHPKATAGFRGNRRDVRRPKAKRGTAGLTCPHNPTKPPPAATATASRHREPPGRHREPPGRHRAAAGPPPRRRRAAPGRHRAAPGRHRAAPGRRRAARPRPRAVAYVRYRHREPSPAVATGVPAVTEDHKTAWIATPRDGRAGGSGSDPCSVQTGRRKPPSPSTSRRLRPLGLAEKFSEFGLIDPVASDGPASRPHAQHDGHLSRPSGHVNTAGRGCPSVSASALDHEVTPGRPRVLLSKPNGNPQRRLATP
jgi:hypothetical protein